MHYAIKDLPKSQKEARIEIAAEELKPFMERAASDMSQRAKIEGFRPGKAPYDVIAKRFGEMAVLEEALPSVVRKYLVEIVAKEQLETVGEPTINVEKTAPGNEVIFTAKFSLLPRVSKLVDVRKISIPAKDVSIKDEEVEKVVKELRKMQSKEIDVEREVRAGDKVIVDLDMSLDKVPVEGGAAREHAIYTEEPHYVPGLNEKMYGMKKGENRAFTLKFPADHYNKMLAGKDIDFSVSLKGLQEIDHPELNDEFAKSLGQPTMNDLHALLRKNLQEEADFKETQRQEIAALEEIIKQSKIDDLPDTLINVETHKMVHELEHSVEKQGLVFEEYLKNIKKTKDQLMLEFTPEAAKRVKSTVLLREIGKQEKLEATDAEALDEQMKLLNTYKDDAATQERIRSEEGEDFIRGTLRNRKVLKFIRETTVKK